MSMFKSVKETVVSALGFGSTNDEPKNIGIYGPPNAGKTTLANRISDDWGYDPIGSEAPVPHETRRVRKNENIVIEADGHSACIDIVDTPGVSTSVDSQEFVEGFGLDEETSKQRARESTEGITEAMDWLREDIDGVIYLMDASEDPYTQVNTMMTSLIESENIPVLVVANKIDLDDADPKNIEEAYPQHENVAISAKEGENINTLYRKIGEKFG